MAFSPIASSAKKEPRLMSWNNIYSRRGSKSRLQKLCNDNFKRQCCPCAWLITTL